MSTSAIIRGYVLPYLQSETWEFDPARGFIHKLEYKGASQVQMLALQQDYVRSGIACHLRFNQGDTSTLDVEDATQQYTLDTWQILGNEERPDALGTAAVVNAATAAQIILLRKGLSNEDPVAKTFVGTLAPLAGGAVQRIYEHYLLGETEFLSPQYVLRHTTNTPSRWNVNVADIGVLNIYTPAQLLSETQDTGAWYYPLPGRLAFKIANIPSPTARANYLWGWLKGPSTETTAANNRIEIATEYIAYQWSLDKYPAH